MDDPKECLICFLKFTAKCKLIRLRSDERVKLICFSKVRMDKKHSRFENFTKLLDVHEECFKNYLCWEQAIHNRESNKNLEEIDSEVTENEVFSYDSQCIYCATDASDGYIKKGKKKSKTHNEVYIKNDEK